MLSNEEYVLQSLELNTFFMRIMKEHSFFIEVAFPAKNSNLIQQADMFKNHFAMLLNEAVQLADGIVPGEFLNAGEIVTNFTLSAEQATEFYSGSPLFTEITRAELSMGGSGCPNIATLVEQVNCLNQQAMGAVQGLIDFKTRLLNDILTCRVFTFNYPLLIDHILREARFYLDLLQRIQSRVEVDIVTEAIRQEAFWNRIMAEHAKFIRGLLDPTEVKLFNAADNFGKQFDVLTAQATALINQTAGLPAVTEESRKAAVGIRDFKKQGTEGLITCKIKSIMVPLLGDHVLREANHYLRLLRIFKQSMITC
jgi:hypothetical protein